MPMQWVVVALVALLGIVWVGAAAKGGWFESQPLRKCAGLSIVVHLFLATVLASVGGLRPHRLFPGPAGDAVGDDSALGDDATLFVMELAPASPFDDGVRDGIALRDTMLADDGPAADPPPLLALDPPPPPAAAVDQQAPEAPGGSPLLDDAVSLSSSPTLEAQPPGLPARSGQESPSSPEATASDSVPVPDVYASRTGPRQAAALQAGGGSADTEKAVQAALAWLVRAQSEEGQWEVARHGGGIGKRVDGEHPQGASGRADCGVSGLALLAILGSGTTHREGPHSRTVARGLTFLTARQRADGSLAGEAEFFAALYCHGMATLALAEAAALSGDPALRAPLERAVQYTLSAQHPATGGWRYAAGDRGDTSQFGWQVMVLSSAKTAGLGGLEMAERRARGFLQSVSSGRSGGLAAYRTGERPTVAMTAEALACRLFLGTPASDPAVAEGVELLSRALPDSRAPNAYTWYYGTLASFHAGGPAWERWNNALQAALLPLQRHDGGPLDGSFDPDPVWGGHGGRVYATALAALSLEVYYRHTPQGGPGGAARVTVARRR